jgi:hypothetical protein
MDYSKYLGKFVEDPMTYWEDDIMPYHPNIRLRDYELRRPRLGVPEGMLPWESNKNDIDKVLFETFTRGHIYIPGNINSQLRQHLEHFRNCLDIYDIMVDKKVFSIDEIFHRSLSEGPAYTKFISKSRQQSLQAETAIDTVDTKDEYVHSEYSGYDSIIHERYLPYWDDSEDTVDWVYSLIPPEEGMINDIEFRTIANRLINKWNWDQCIGPLQISFLPDIAGKVTSVNSEDGKTTQLKNAWALHDGSGPWMATRRVVPANGNKTRDTGVPDVPTLCKLKMIHQVCRRIGKVNNYVANCDGRTLIKRVERIKNKRRFLHIDFKKFGLTYLREHPNTLLDLLGLGHLSIDEFYLITDRGTVRTERGTVLGWLDPLVALVTSIILHDIKEKMSWDDMDFIIFNDDIEIGFDEKDESVLQLRRHIIISRLEHFGFIMSHRKIYISEMFIFLENYEYPGKLNMNKTQLVVKQFANALSTPYTWEAKSNFADAWRFYKSYRIKEMIQNSINCVFGPDEYEKPVELGGWTHHMSGGLNVGLLEADPGEIAFYIKMSRWKRPLLPEKYVFFDMESIEKGKHALIGESLKGRNLERTGIEFDIPVVLSAEDIDRLNLMIGAHSHLSTYIPRSTEPDLVFLPPND